MNKITPYNNSKTKKEQVKSMFNNIAKNYDFLNQHYLLECIMFGENKQLKN